MMNFYNEESLMKNLDNEESLFLLHYHPDVFKLLAKLQPLDLRRTVRLVQNSTLRLLPSSCLSFLRK